MTASSSGGASGASSRRSGSCPAAATARVSAGVAAGITVLAALFFGFAMAAVVAGVSAIANALGKVSLDAIIQRDVTEKVRTSVFAWSETVLQIAWVVGGGLGIALPLEPRLGFGVISGLLVVVLLLSVQVRRSRS